MTSLSSLDPSPPDRRSRLVAVTQRVLVDPVHGERRDALDQRWPVFLDACGLTAVPVPNNPRLAVAYVRRLEVCGVLLTGGNDLAVLGGDAPERDAAEIALLRLAADGLPVLGICRGLQLTLDYFGARPAAVSGHVATRHELAFQGRARQVNSYHGYGVTAAAVSALPGQPLEVTAASSDGIVEAVRHRTLPIAGLMWHPERETPFDPADIALFRTFFGALS